MKRFFVWCTLALCLFISLRATCGKVKPFSKAPSQVIKIADWVYYHNMSITFDGTYYYTINGGNDGYCTLNQYDKQGEFIESYDLEIDGRAIFYHSEDEMLYVKIYGTDLYAIELFFELADVHYYDMFSDDNSSPAATPDGKYVFELVDGKVTMYDVNSGEDIRSYRITKYYEEHGFANSIAASDNYLFVWGDTDEIYVYDHNGTYITNILLPRDGYGFSLSYCNGLLWVAKDADASQDGGNGYWYGFEL